MLINSVQKIPSIQRKISVEFRDPAHQLSADILGSYLWRYLYLTSVNRPPDKSAYWKTIFSISHPKHMLWVLKRTVSMRQFF